MGSISDHISKRIDLTRSRETQECRPLNRGGKLEKSTIINRVNESWRIDCAIVFIGKKILASRAWRIILFDTTDDR